MAEQLPRYVLHTGGWFKVGHRPVSDVEWEWDWAWFDPERPYDWAYDPLTTLEKIKADGWD